jgi:hypothetical protein
LQNDLQARRRAATAMHFFLFVSFSLRQDCGQVGIERQAHCRRGITWAFEWHQKISLGMDNSLFFFGFFFFFLFIAIIIIIIIMRIIIALLEEKNIMPPSPPRPHFSPQNFSSHVQLFLLLLLLWAGWGFFGTVKGGGLGCFGFFFFNKCGKMQIV